MAHPPGQPLLDERRHQRRLGFGPDEDSGDVSPAVSCPSREGGGPASGVGAVVIGDGAG